MADPKNALPAICFAVPLTDERLAKYRALIEAEPAGEVKDALVGLLACVTAWWALPVSTRTDSTKIPVLVPSGKLGPKGEPIRGKGELTVTPLEESHVKSLWDVTPWMRELDTLSTPRDDGLFDKLPKSDLRHAAFDLLWHCKEITLDREPLDQSRLELGKDSPSGFAGKRLTP